MPGPLEPAGTSVKRKSILDHGDVAPLHPLPAVTALDHALAAVMNLGLEAVMIPGLEAVMIPALSVDKKRRVESQRSEHHVLRLPERTKDRQCAGS